MGRFLLDTNILIFLLLGQKENISKDVQNICQNYNNLLYISSISIIELTQLVRIGKVKDKKYKNIFQMLDSIKNDLYIEIIPFTQHHAYAMAQLEVIEHHNDPMDHAIMAQAMSENLTLVSSDRKMKEYIHQGLDFVWNKR